MMSYQHLLSPVASTSNKNPQIQYVVLVEIIGFSFINTCFFDAVQFNKFRFNSIRKPTV